MKAWKRGVEPNWYCNLLIYFLIICCMTIGILGCGSSGGDTQADDPTVELATTRDDKGVWFISGENSENLYDVFEAMGYAVATDRLWQAETYRRQARGTLAEIFGSDQLQTDIYVRSLSYTEAELQDGFNALSTDAQDTINGYVAGFNRRIQEIRDDPAQLPYEFTAIGEQLGSSFMPKEWTYQDILAWLAMLQRQFDPEALNITQVENARLYQRLVADFGASGPGMFEDLRWINDPDAQTVIPSEAARGAQNDVKAASYGSEDIYANQQDPLDYQFEPAIRAMKDRRENYIDSLKRINAYVKMGSYAWVVSGDHTVSGNPILYSGPQMGFSVPSIVLEGAINAGGLQVSGMTVPGIPLILVGRTPHHAWSMQVGHAHTTDLYIENSSSVTLDRMETIKVAGQEDVVIPVYRSDHGPIGNPIPYDPANYNEATDGPILSWKYAHWGYEFKSVEAFLQLIKATSMDEFGQGIEHVGTSQHFCYVDRDGNIAYWMSGRNPVRPSGEWRMPQGSTGPMLEWDAAVLTERSTDRNPGQGYYGGWNNKTNSDYDNAYNSTSDIYGPFHRAHVVREHLEAMLTNQEKLTFEEIRDLALNIATTDSFSEGGNPWVYIRDYFIAAVNAAGADLNRDAALSLLAEWDGHFVDGDDERQWIGNPDRADAWLLIDAWIDMVLALTFADEGVDEEPDHILFNVLIHGLEDNPSGIQNRYDWFTNMADPGAPQTADDIIVTALDRVLTTLDLNNRPWGRNARGRITFTHSLIGEVHSTPFSSRSTYAHCVEYASSGPVRIESMFPLGQSGDIRTGAGGTPVFNENFFSMAKDLNNAPILYDLFEMREFPLLD